MSNPPSKNNQKKIRSLVKQELKRAIEPKRYSFTNTANTIGSPANGPYSNKIFANIAQGVNSNQRVGHVLNASGFYAQYTFKHAGVGPVTQVLRVVLVAPYDDASSLATDNLSTVSVIDPDRYQVLYDRMFTLTQDTDSQNKRIIIKRKFKRMVRYDSAATAAPVKGNLQLYIVSEEATAVNKPTINGHWIIHYRDA